MNPLALQSLFGIKPALAQRWAEPIRDAMAFADCTTKNRQADYLAQIGHESGRLRYSREIWGPTAQQKRYEPWTTLAGRLGNTQPGDGERYMGRCHIQTTGRGNYRMTTAMFRKFGINAPDFEAEPELLERDLWAALGAALYWRVKNLNRFSDSGDFAEQTRRINGGYNGIADRQALRARALILL